MGSELSVIMQFLIAASLLVAGSTAQLVTYPNGAVAPFDPNVAIATANHYAAKIAHGSYFPYAGALGVHPAAAVYGRKKREAQLPVNLVTGYSHVGYPYFGYGVAPVVAPFVAHPNGALVPAEPKEVVDARAEHLAAHAVEKREAQVPVNLVTGYSAVAGLGYPYHFGYGVAPVVAPFVAHPNGALVPAEPKEVVDARAEHLAAHAVEKREAQIPV